MNSFFSLRFDINTRKTTRDVFLVFVATPRIVPEALATLLEDEIDRNLAPDEVIIVVRDCAFDSTFAELTGKSQNLQTVARFARRTTVMLVGYNIFGREVRRSKISGPDATFAIQFDDFKRRALTSIFNSRNGFVESTDTYHFENPSGRHTERFIRLSNILARGAEIAFIGFCTLPYVPDEATVAYLDTPSLYAVVSAINEQRGSFGKQPILADNFSSYAGVGDYPFADIDAAIFLISASSSGSLAAKLVADHHFDAARMTHILFLGTDKSGSNIVCNLAHDPELNSEGVKKRPLGEPAKNCRMCARGSHAVKLQGDQFDFAGPQQDPLLIKRDHGPKGLPGLMGRFAGGGIFSVKMGRRARQFNVEPDALLRHDAFQERVTYALRRSVPASLKYVIALDGESLAFADQIAQSVEPKATIVKRSDIDAVIPKASPCAIAIAAIIIESGRSLLDISRDLRGIAPKAPLLYFVGLSKTTGEPRRASLVQTLKQTHNHYPYEVMQVEEMILPLGNSHSPWESELKLFRMPEVRSLIPPDLVDFIGKRMGRLRQTSRPLTDDLFLANEPGRRLELQPGFVFWPDKVPERSGVTQADVFFTVASVLQQLRANAHETQKPAIKSNWFQQTVLAPGNFGRFNDDIIQASILRAAFPHEMNFADSQSDSRELGRLIGRIIAAEASDRGGAAAEFLLALATHRLRLHKDDLEMVLVKTPASLPMISFLQAVCRLSLSK